MPTRLDEYIATVTNVCEMSETICANEKKEHKRRIILPSEKNGNEINARTIDAMTKKNNNKRLRVLYFQLLVPTRNNWEKKMICKIGEREVKLLLELSRE